jgi:hypothetical protein
VPIKLRHAKGRRRREDQIPQAARWWLKHGTTAEGADWNSWQSAILHYEWPIAANSSFWTRRDLIELGYGRQIDAHVQAGRCPPTGWRKPMPATAI